MWYYATVSMRTGSCFYTPVLLAVNQAASMKVRGYLKTVGERWSESPGATQARAALDRLK